MNISLADRTYQGHLTQVQPSHLPLGDEIKEHLRTIETIIHDINNHMTTILGSADLSLMHVESHAEIYENIDIIKKVGLKIQVLLHSLSETIGSLDSDNVISNSQIESDSQDCLPKQINVENSMNQNRGRILVMDDKREVRSVVGRILIRWEYEVDATPDGINTIEKYERNMKSGKKI